jgi:hypothetical protein
VSVEETILYEHYHYDYKFKVGERVKAHWGKDTIVRGTIQWFYGELAVAFDTPVHDAQGNRYLSRPISKIPVSLLNTLELLAEL